MNAPFPLKYLDFASSKNFSSTEQNEYRAHVRSEHDGKKPFKCEFCDLTFWRRCNVRYHVEASHDLKKRFSCDLCDFQSYYEKSIDMHKKSVHQKLNRPKPFNCLKVWQLYCFQIDLRDVRIDRLVHRNRVGTGLTQYFG